MMTPPSPPARKFEVRHDPDGTPRYLVDDRPVSLEEFQGAFRDPRVKIDEGTFRDALGETP